MKNTINLSNIAAPVPGITKKLFPVLSFFIATIFMISCRKEIGEKMNPSVATDSTADGQTALAAASGGSAYYLSPSGNDNNSGTAGSPWFTLNKVWTVIAPGDTVYLRGGTYSYSQHPYLENKNGTAASKIYISGYPGERPVVTRAANYTWQPEFHRSGAYFSGDYFHWKNIRFTGFFQPAGDGNVHSAFMAYHSNNNTFENLEFDNSGAGFSMEGNSTGNLLLNCDAHDNKDPVTNYGNGDGIQLTYCAAGTVNTVRNCRSWNNSDDGFDVFENKGYVTLEGCWSSHNGFIPGTNNTGGNGNGYKFGYSTNDNEIRRTLRNCLAVNNRLTGFDIQEATCRLQMDNCISYKNGNGTGLANGFNTNYQSRAHIIRNCVAYANDDNQINLNGQTIITTSSASGIGTGNWTDNVSDADFASIDATQLVRARKSGGSLPDITFLNLASGSDLINTGTNIGLPYTGSAPDRGAFESGGTTTPPTNQSPLANAGADKTIVLPVTTVSITGSGSDPDGTITSYAWSFRSGPNTPVLAGITGTTLAASNLVAGTYVFRLTVTDNGGLTALDEVNVLVSAVAPPPPTSTKTINVAQAVFDAGFAYYVAQDFGTLADNSTSPTRSVLRIFENGAELSPAHSSHSDIQNTGRGRFSHWADGSFVALYFSASDNSNPKTNGRTYTYSIGTVTSNQSPLANAGADKAITLPVNTVSVTGSGSDPDGTIASYAWSFRSGPNTPVFAGATGTTLSASNLVAGTYVFRLTVTDNGGLTALDEVNVVVSAVAPPPSTKTINVAQAVFDAGFAYYVAQDFGVLADNSTNPTRSVLRIFENGKELSPAHSVHSDIQNTGKGHFSHWADGSFVALYFSASDNSNPKTNGRTYTYAVN